MTNARLKTEALRTLVRNERNASADVVLALAEFDRELRYSKGAAAYRNSAVALVHKHPDVIEPIRDGRLCLTVVNELSHVVTAENLTEVMPRFFGLSKREAKMLVAELAPKEVVPRREVVTDARTGKAVRKAELLVQPVELENAAERSVQPVELKTQVPLQPVEVAPDVVEPMNRRELRVHITVSVDFYRKLERAKVALAHKYPSDSSEAILSEGLDLVLKGHAKRKGLVEKPRKAAKKPASNEVIPADVKREVWTRDAGKCQWPLESGGICGTEKRVGCCNSSTGSIAGRSPVS